MARLHYENRKISDWVAELERLRGLNAELLAACQEAMEHLAELEDAWQRGSIEECDGQGGTRSNRNVAVGRRIEAAITKAKGETS